MRRGFELFKTRALSDTIDFRSLENAYSIKIPPLYKLFLNTFYVGEDLIYYDKFFLDRDKDHFECSCFYSELTKDQAMFTGFLSIERSLELFNSVYGYDEEIIQRNLIPIGTTASSKTIFLGTQNEDIDLLFMDTDLSGEFINLDVNIVQFVQSIVLEPLGDDELRRGTKFSQLYKNWGEDFWRVKE
jgi:hypothetical protein